MNSPSICITDPPARAQCMYKVVAMLEGVATSIYDGTTIYPVGHTVHHPVAPNHRGGLYCYHTVEECLARDDVTFPRECALLGAPRAILQVLAWNCPDVLVPVTYGKKIAFSHLHVRTIIPMPSSWTAMRAGEATMHLPDAMTASTSSTDGGSGRTVLTHAQLISTPTTQDICDQPVTRSSNSSAGPEGVQNIAARPSVARPSSARVARSQARTIELELEVSAMEDQLRRARGLLL
ncbi:hypothetical protein CEUSTIGMA_g10148.t1 [Chlamydomonas eustigma]|uniref:Uncharacterized protein n=1 Tax=Chlamydomonas eustigma TaxID=1157962 RepID=A0A250XII3_9CHLO|nr:hypothetical protein CEUSTIGMA_g10148.t1 [Chlamydomonas eustigma]|eukprot:GAX82722.1 hypothetical protein CEUSTIGMA_g10148.t1 [Chlamydomonas eustigma]